MRVIICISFFFLHLILIGCWEKEIKEGPLVGTVLSYDNRLSEASDQSGVRVVIEGTEPQIAVETNSDGEFYVEKLKTGTYDLVFSKTGFGIHKIIDYQFEAGENPSTVSTFLVEFPAVRVDHFKIEILEPSNPPTLQGTVHLGLSDEDVHHGYLRYYLNNGSLNPGKYAETGIIPINDKVITFDKTIDTEIYPPGTKLYALVLPCTEPNLSYIEESTGKIRHSSVSIERGSFIESIIVPFE